jgi:uncharacterized membrane protein YoaK (UPF0700 family)
VELVRAALLSAVAGFVDALGYLTLGGVFAANMTGNLVIAAIAFGQGRWSDGGGHMAVIACFFLGVIAGRVLTRLAPKSRFALLAEGLLLASTAAAPRDPRLFLLALAMGFQIVAQTRFGRVPMLTIVMTGNMERFGAGLIDRIWPPGDAQDRAAAPLLPIAAAALAYGAGAVASVPTGGAAAALLVPAAIVLALALLGPAPDEGR